MFKVTYIDGKDNHKTKEKFFKTRIEAEGFIIVAHMEYYCYKFKIEKTA